MEQQQQDKPAAVVPSNKTIKLGQTLWGRRQRSEKKWA